jgi:hypothetical protein
MDFVWISGQTAIFPYLALADIVLEAQLSRSMFAERHFVFTGCAVTQVFSMRPLNALSMLNPNSLHVSFVVGKVAPMQASVQPFHFSPVSII